MSSNKKNIKTRKKDRKAFMNPKLMILSGTILLLALLYFIIPQGSDKWSVDDNGTLSYPENRGHVDVSILKSETGQEDSLKIVSFQSKDYVVEAILRIPLEKKKVPGIVILPGATITKEGTQTLADIFSGMGYASIGIEQRNRGGVDIRSDYDLWKKGIEPVQHKMVFDALRAVDVLRQMPSIDPEKIAIVGVSNGGRFAIIAAAIDPRISGVIGISTSGYDIESQVREINDANLIKFYRSIDPDSYLRFLPPRKIVMMHAVNDSIIPIGLAWDTFNKSFEPKQFYSIAAGTHGYSEDMKDDLEKELRMMLG